MDKIRYLKRLENINDSIDWKNIESVFLSHYVVDTILATTLTPSQAD